MIERKTVLDQIEIRRNGEVALRFGLLLVEDGNEIGCEWHRTVVPPGADPAAQIEIVNKHFAMGVERKDGSVMKPKPIPADEIPRVAEVCKLIHKADVVKNYKAEEEKRRKAAELR